MAFAQGIPGTEEKSGVSNDAYKKTGNGSSGGMDFYVSQIAGIGTGMLGASILTQCLEGLKTPSIATFMAGSLVHIASEILGAKKKNDRNKKKINDLKLKQEDLAKSGDTSQLESLKAFLVEEEDTYEFLGNRKKWMIAVDVIYAAAVGFAIAEQVYGIASRSTTATSTCTVEQTALATAKCTTGVLPPVVAACIAADIAIEIPLCIANATASAEGVKAAVVSHAAARTALKAACAGVYYAECYAAGEAEFALAYAACKQVPVDGGVSMFSWTGLLGMAYGFGSGQLNKDGGQVASYGAMAVSLLSAFVPAVSKVVAQTYNFPIPRAITFGALLVMSGVNTAGLAHRENISVENIVKIKNAISQFKIETEGEGEGVRLGATAGKDNDLEKNKKKMELKKLSINKTKTCISNSSGRFDMSDKACSRPLKLSRPSFNRVSVPVLNNVASLGTDMAQALADGDERRASEIAVDVGNMAARVKKVTEELKVSYNEMLKKNKQPTLDFNKAIAQQVASIQGTLNQAARSKNLDLASMASGSGTSDNDKASDVPVVTTAGNAPGVVLPDADPLAGLGGTEEPAVEARAAIGATQSLDDFESTEQDVSKKSDVSIFKQLSNRYILNYTKMFDRKKEPDVVQEEPKKN